MPIHWANITPSVSTNRLTEICHEIKFYVMFAIKSWEWVMEETQTQRQCVSIKLTPSLLASIWRIIQQSRRGKYIKYFLLFSSSLWIGLSFSAIQWRFHICDFLYKVSGMLGGGGGRIKSYAHWNWWKMYHYFKKWACFSSRLIFKSDLYTCQMITRHLWFSLKNICTLSCNFQSDL